MQWFFVSCEGTGERHYLCSSHVVSAKRFLNYLRRYKRIRPAKVTVKSNDDKRWEIEVSWYKGKLKAINSAYDGAEGEWWHIEKVIKK